MNQPPCAHRVDPPGRPRPTVQPDVTHAARCFQELMRRQGICESLRRAIRRESDRAVKRRLRLVLRRAEVKERAAIQDYQKALKTAARAILAKYYPDYTPE
ncbi:MAG: hypothetical protein IT317_21255 [Anaerolineales bacterium]|nr:hypothetical protein [Anaerolineales bacterium]